MFNFSREHFKVDTFIPAIQTAATFIADHVTGRLGGHTAKPQTVVLVSSIASVVSNLANNFFHKAFAYYASIPIGVGVGIAAHRFFYPSVPLEGVLDGKGALIIILVLATVKLVADNLHRLITEETDENEVEVAVGVAVKADVDIVEEKDKT